MEYQLRKKVENIKEWMGNQKMQGKLFNVMRQIAVFCLISMLILPMEVLAWMSPAALEKAASGLIEQELYATIYMDQSYETLSDDETQIVVSGLMPIGAVVKAYPVEVPAERLNEKELILAYDIVVADAQGRLFEQAAQGSELTVMIQSADWVDADGNDTMEVYYIPEEGALEKMQSVSEKDAVRFTTEHFSTYAVAKTALEADGSQATIYLNGSSGNDNNAGTSVNTAVKTFAKAVSLVKDGGTIYISGTVTVSDAQEWSFGSSTVTIKRYNFTGPLINVTSGGSLTLANITINGGSGTPSSSNIATNSTYASGSAKAPLIVVNTGGHLVVNSGTLLEYNSNQPNLSNNKFVENGHIGLGGAVYCSGSFTMNGGLIQYCEAQCGGGVYVENGSFYLNGGTIDHNYARDIVSYRNRVGNFHKNAGGGVYIGDNATMTMTGGTVSNNQSAREGGGISLGWLNRSDNAGIDSYITTFTMNGGTITGNYAVSTGGGLNITAGRQAFINAGYITYNTAMGQEYQDSSTWVDSGTYTSVFSGGGIYIDAAQWSNYASERHDGVPGKAVINCVLITQNKANSYGGGIAACATSANYVYGDETNGTAIYANTAASSSYSSEIYIEDGEIDLGNTLLGGGTYAWSGRSVYYGYGYKNSLTDNSAAIVAAKNLATVFITNNKGYLGGGIGCNGLIEIGGEKEESTYINIKKVWEDDGMLEHPEYIEVQILQDGKAYGAPIRIYRTYDENGNEVWPAFYVGGLPSGHTYTVKELEVPGYMATIEAVGQDFIITNRPIGFPVVKKWQGDEETDRPDTITVQLYQNGVPYGEPVELAGPKWSYIWVDLPENDAEGNPCEYTVQEVEIPDGYYTTGNGGLNADGVWEITNIKSPETSVSVEKKWADGNPGADSVIVQLLANGEPYGDPVTLSAVNNWFHKWEKLQTIGKDGNPVEYTVVENAVSGYETKIELGTRQQPGKVWQTATALESGNTYLLVSSSGALAVQDTLLAWEDVSNLLESGELPDVSVLWTYNGSKLQNGTGKYIYMSKPNYSNTYSFSAGTSGSGITYENSKYFKATSGGTTRYFGSLSTANGTASAVDRTSNATQFTVYVQAEDEDPCADWGDKHFIVTNTKLPDPIDIVFTKYSIDSIEDTTFEKIPGAVMDLYQVDESAESAIPGTDVKGTLIAGWTTEDQGVNVELYSGIYYLIETTVPTGHIGLSGPIIFEVDTENKQITVLSYPERSDLEGTLTGAGDAFDFPIYNTATYVLPETGGTGTSLYIIAGIILAAGAMLLLFIRQRRTLYR